MSNLLPMDEAVGQSNQRRTTSASRNGSRRPRRTAEPAVNPVNAAVCQAQGMLMERHRLSADEAMLMMHQCADETSTSVQAVADALVATRRRVAAAVS